MTRTFRLGKVSEMEKAFPFQFWKQKVYFGVKTRRADSEKDV